MRAEVLVIIRAPLIRGADDGGVRAILERSPGRPRNVYIAFCKEMVGYIRSAPTGGLREVVDIVVNVVCDCRKQTAAQTQPCMNYFLGNGQKPTPALRFNCFSIDLPSVVLQD